MENKNYNQSLPPLEPGTFLKDGQFEIKRFRGTGTLVR